MMAQTTNATVDVSLAARQYVSRGWVLVPIEHGTKGPNGKGWNTLSHCITQVDQCSRIKGNMGLAHAFSRTAALDLDDILKAAAWLATHGVVLQALLDAPDAVRVSSGRPNRAKLLYRLPDGIAPLPSKEITYTEDDPETGKPKRRAVFEFRCATVDGLTVQDVLPPSIHPDTGEAYTWEYGDPLIGSWQDLPVLPAELLAVWQGLLAPAAKEVSDKAPLGLGKRELRDLLTHFSPDAGYHEWIDTGFALHHETRGGDLGLDLWDEWSTAGATYKGREDLAQHWDSFGKRTTGPIKTVRSLMSRVPASVTEFEDLSSADGPAGLPTFKRDKLGKIEATLGNVLLALRRPDVCRVQIGHDRFNDELMLAPVGTHAWRMFTDEDYTRLREGLATGGFKEVGRELMRDAVALVAQENAFDSAQVWLDSLPGHDGTARCESFLHRYFGCEDTSYTRAVSMYLWTALAGRVLDPGCQADMAPTILGKQSIGKTSGVKALVPDVAQFVEINLAHRDDNLARSLRGKLVGELGELRGLAGREAEDIKAWISRRHEEWVPKYKEFAVKFARRLVLIGTTNNEEFLVDTTGNRRWLPVRAGVLGAVDVEGIARDRDQLWAEGRELFKAGGVAWRDAEALAAPIHQEHMVRDGWEDVVARWLDERAFDGASPRERKFLRACDVLQEALGVSPKDAGRREQMRIADVLKGLGYERAKVRTDAGPQWVYVVPTVVGN
jgi:hypothetical protein